MKHQKQQTVGLITDTHIRPPGGDESSPYAVNDLANGRARYAAAVLTAQRPDFTVHVGDMVHTLSHMPLYDEACEEAKSILAPLAPHYVAGNHDIGDKPMPATPAATVKIDTIARYEKHFGPCQYHHIVDECCFLTVNSSLIGADDERDFAQRQWLEKMLDDYVGKRFFLFSHYPPFINTPDENLHYDNWRADCRAWLLALLQKYRVEAVFSGHTHQFFYNRRGPTSFYCLPSTSFTRQDFSELYHGVTAPEFGRDDVDKCGVTLLRILPQGHELQVLPTFGRNLEKDETLASPARPTPRGDKVTVNLRHAWHESLSLPANGPMEEFTRKRARDDYALLRLLQMGIRQVRVPMIDLLEPAVRQRSEEIAALGIVFVPVVAEIPSPQTIAALTTAINIIASIEAVVPATSMASVIAMLDPLSTIDKPLTLSKAHSSAHTQTGGRFTHTVSTGFVRAECDALRALIAQPSIAEKVSAIVMQINNDNDLAETTAELATLAADINRNVIVHLIWGDSNPAKANFNDNAILARLQEAMRRVAETPRLSLQLDSYMDIDRGYTPRHGLVDRLANLRPAGRYLAGLPTTR